MPINELRGIFIENFILYYTSNETERKQMFECLESYLNENEIEIDAEGIKLITE